MQNNNNESNINKALTILAVIGFFLMLFSLVGGNNSTSSSNMSEEYQTNSEYRDNVHDTAKAFGTTDEEVDAKINAVVDAANNN